MIKADLRKIYLERRKSLSESERELLSRKIADAFFARFDLEKVRFLHVFLSIRKFAEVETSFVLTRLRKDFPEIELVVPRVDFKAQTLEILRFKPDTKLVKNHWNIVEPAGDEFVEADKIDVVLVPLLCFDRRGFRVGYGKAYYDKFLSLCRADCLKIGLSFFDPIDEIADTNEYDVKLDYCITPERVIEFES